jgi:hypothetical protein
MIESHGILLQTIFTEAPPIVATALAINGDKTKKGGYLCITDHEGRLQVEILVGSFPNREKSTRSTGFALEKNCRLAAHPEHLSAFQSADESLDQYPGAIRGTNFLFSFSGLPALWDEACMLSLALQVKEIEIERVRQIVTISKNPFACHLLPTGTLD